MIKALPHISAMAPYALAPPAPAGAVALDQNESAFPPSPAAIRAGRNALTAASLYPDSECHDLRTAIAEAHGIRPEGIVCSAGSMELILALLRSYVGPGNVVLGSAYGYLYTATVTAQCGANYVTAPEDDLTVDVDALIAAVTHDVRVVFICNPGNPTGTLIAPAEIVRLRTALPDDVLLVVDQAYGEFSDRIAPPQAVFDLVERGDTVVLRTLSKAYGLAGVRIGWGVFPDAIAHEVRKVLNPANLTSVTQAMAAAAMRDPEHMRDIVSRTGALRDQFVTDVAALGIEVVPSHTNFVLMRFEDVAQCGRVDAALRARGFHGRGMAGYGLSECLRITIGDQAAMAALMTCLKEIIA